MSEMIWPRTLQPASGPMRADKLDGAAEGMGDWGTETKKLAEMGLVPPDMMTGLTLFILGHQPKDPNKQKMPGAGGGVAGGVWVRERFTISQPLKREDVFSVTGQAIGRHVHKGRRYGSNRSETVNAAGELVGRNLTNGLLAYKVEEGLADTLEGEDPNHIPAPEPDWTHAADNPHAHTLQELRVGDQLESGRITVSLRMMEARDTKKPDNPIHSDPKLAAQAGLKKPIAGGSHVLAFPLELILIRCGTTCLLYGSAFDVRWKTPVYADTVMHASAEVVAKDRDLVTFDIAATLEEGAVAMTGNVRVPLA